MDVPKEDVPIVMHAARLLDQAGDELHKVVKNRDRIMRNRNNKQQELRELREKIGEISLLVSVDRAPMVLAEDIRHILAR